MTGSANSSCPYAMDVGRTGPLPAAPPKPIGSADLKGAIPPDYRGIVAPQLLKLGGRKLSRRAK